MLARVAWGSALCSLSFRREACWFPRGLDRGCCHAGCLPQIWGRAVRVSAERPLATAANSPWDASGRLQTSTGFRVFANRHFDSCGLRRRRRRGRRSRSQHFTNCRRCADVIDRVVITSLKTIRVDERIVSCVTFKEISSKSLRPF